VSPATWVFGSAPPLTKGHAGVTFQIWAVLQGRQLVAPTRGPGSYRANELAFLPERLIPVGAGLIGLWPVEEGDPRFRERYRITGPSIALPSEIMSIPPASSDPDLIRDLLIRGVEVHTPKSDSVFLELADGRVLGPFRVGTLPAGVPGIALPLHDFSAPLQTWKNIERFSPLAVEAAGSIRRFSALVDVPARDGLYDCAELGTSLRSVLGWCSKVAGGASVSPHLRQPLITRVQLTKIIELLNTEAPETIACRFDRVSQSLRLAAESGERTAELTQYLLSQPAVRGIIEARVIHLGEEERVRIATEERDALLRTEALTATVAGLEQKGRDLQNQLTENERMVEETARSMPERVRRRLEEARSDPSGTLALAEVLRSYLQPTARERLEVERKGSASTLKAWVDWNEVLGALTNAFEGAGISRLSSSCLARETTTALLAGQLVMFRGSVAGSMARVTAATLAGSNHHVARIRAGASGREVSLLINDTRSTGRTRATLTAVTLEGMNRSALETYQDEIRSQVESESLRADADPNALLLIGTLISGPTVLTIGPEYTELGPIFDTDVLAHSPGPVARHPAATDVLKELWLSPLKSSGIPTPSLEDHLRVIEARQNALWDRLVHRAANILSALPVGDGFPTVLQSLAFGWLLPRAEALGVGAKVMNETFGDGRLDGVRADTRIGRYLKRFSLTEENAESDAD
jgi:hypothetical protein